MATRRVVVSACRAALVVNGWGRVASTRIARAGVTGSRMTSSETPKDPPGPLRRRELARTEAPPLEVRALRSVERCLLQAGLESPKARLGRTEGGGGARPGHASEIEPEPRVPGNSSDETGVGQTACAPGCFEAEPWIERTGNGIGVHGRGEVAHPLAPLLRGDQPLTVMVKS